MKKLFNASLVALAVAGTFGAQAASVSSTPLEFSKEGVAAGFTETASDLVVDIVVTKDHPASSFITLDFGKTADLSGILYNGGAVVNTPGTGQGVAQDITFDYGTGSFTFDNVSLVTETVGGVTYTTGIKFQVNLGNQLSAGSAFRVTIADTTDLVLSGAGSMQYTSTDVTETTVIEEGNGVWGIEKTQFTASVTKEYNNRIERENRLTFAKFEESDSEDRAAFKVVNNDALLAKVTLTNYSVEIEGNYEGVAVADFDVEDSAAVANAIVLTNEAISADNDLYSFDVLLANVSGDDTYNTVFTAPGTEIPVSDFSEIRIVADYNNQAAQAVSTTILAQDYGQWELDASVVNVPYLPVGYETLSSNVEYSNHGSTAAKVSITAFDQNGNLYEGDLPDAAKKTVTKYSEDQIMDALQITAPTKLNITFISDADEENVSIVPYYRQGDSRVQSINDQYKK
ncbi:hypothetical protein ACPV3U_09670 [Vibrio rotiferianus]|uniref:hypothetical protein n=1 Tax=Vibrio rotiferianus TaxID=190895 RepID=UPI00406A702D